MLDVPRLREDLASRGPAPEFSPMELRHHPFDDSREDRVECLEKL